MRELSSFVGRQAEIATIARLLSQSPLVTLAGPGGAGKTRLALRAARAATTDVFVVELAPVSEASIVARTIAATLGIAEDSHEPLLQTLVRSIGDRELLLVLDNCEHLVDACAQVVHHLLGACPELRVLATSREPLGVEGESLVRVPPLKLPTGATVEACVGSEAVELFLQRAQAARTDVALDETSAPVIARLCQRLAGLPLAIELAAARMGSVSLEDLAARLESSNRILSGGHRQLAPRQRSMHATVAWSYDLLSPAERDFFESLCVIAGSFRLELADALNSTGTETLDLLDRLVSASMVQLEAGDGPNTRYRVLAPLRDFGLEQLTAGNRLAELRERHARSMLNFVERIGRDMAGGPHQVDGFRWLDLEWDNVRTALDSAEAAGDVELALRLNAPLWLYWTRPDRRAEGRERLRRILDMPGADAHPQMRARVIGILASSCAADADLSSATPLLDEALSGAIRSGDVWLEAVMVRLQGQLRLYGGDLEHAGGPLCQALDLAQRDGLHTIETLTRVDLASVAAASGQYAEAEQQLRSAARVAVAAQDAWGEAMAMNGLGDLLRSQGDIDAATEAYQRARPILEASNRDRVHHGTLHNLAYLALARGATESAMQLFVESAEQYRSVGDDRRGVAECLVGLGCVALRLRQPECAARWFGAADANLEHVGSTLTPSNRVDYDRGRVELQRLLTPQQLERFDAEGRRMSIEQALQLARDLAARSSAAGPSAELTPREREVAQLLARGLRNRQIAEALVITEKTAANHVQRVLDKLGATSRAEVAARAGELGLIGS